MHSLSERRSGVIEEEEQWNIDKEYRLFKFKMIISILAAGSVSIVAGLHLRYILVELGYLDLYARIYSTILILVMAFSFTPIIMIILEAFD